MTVNPACKRKQRPTTCQRPSKGEDVSHSEAFQPDVEDDSQAPDDTEDAAPDGITQDFVQQVPDAVLDQNEPHEEDGGVDIRDPIGCVVMFAVGLRCTPLLDVIMYCML